MKILVVGGGGREHALLWALRRDAADALLFCLPGNAGTAQLATNLPGRATDRDAVTAAARERQVDLVVVGPEAPLAAGLADRLTHEGIPVFGPTAAAARIESSKAFAKQLLLSRGIPTAQAQVFRDAGQAARYIDAHPEPLVVKAAGLAGGKGAVVCRTRTQARQAARAMLTERVLGEAGAEILVEEFVVGEELSVLAITDGEHFVMLPPVQDHKRLLEGEQGPNTGGMGAYCPVGIATPALLRRIASQVIEPTLGALREVGAPFKGTLYAGLMILDGEAPMVLEFNCRFGDPEAQAVLPLLPGGLVPVLRLVAEGGWMPDGLRLGEARGAGVTTVLATAGYPEAPVLGAEVRIPPELETASDLLIFHAGTARDPEGRLRVAGGRVLAVTATATSVAEAAARSRAAADAISFEGKHGRRDIAWREIAGRESRNARAS